MPASTHYSPRWLSIVCGVIPFLLFADARLATAQAQMGCADPFGCETNPPTVWIAPASGTHLSSANAEIAAGACDDTDVASVTLYGPNGYLAFATGAGWGCATAVASTPLAVGANIFTAYACDVYGNCSWSSATIYVDAPPPSPQFGISVVGDGAVGTVFTDQTGTVWLKVTNTGNATGTVSLSAWCNDVARDCRIVEGNGSRLTPGASITIRVGYTAASSGGVAKVSARGCFVESPSTCSDSYVTVLVMPAPVASMVVSPTSVMLLRRSTARLIVTLYDASGHTLRDRLITYSSSDPEIVAASSDGVLTGRQVGRATVRITSEGVSRETSVTVRAPVASMSVMPGAVTVQVGSTIQLLAQLFDAEGHLVALPANGPVINWSSSSSIATVTPAGAVTARVNGTAQITAIIDGQSATTVVTVQDGPVSNAISVVTRGLTPGTSVERDECVTIAVGDDAAYECGDLRITHALPTTVTMGRPRTPALLYNSRHAVGGALVAADVMYSGATPTELLATVRIGNRPDVTQRFPWRPACSHQRCRIVIPIVDPALATGVYEFALDVRAVTATSVLASGAAVTDSVIVVNRARSPYGAGWWIDGLEQLLYPAEGKVLWVGGDGSTRLFQRVGQTDSYVVTAAIDRPELLEYVRPTGRWRRWLRNRAYVEFDAGGRHVATVNRQGHATTFDYYWSAPSSPLRTIVLPVRSAVVSRTYEFSYNPTTSGGWILSSVGSPGQQGAARTTTINHDVATGAMIVGIEDPDKTTVTFGLTGARIDSRQNRLRDQTTYEYDAAGALASVSLDMLRTRGQRAAVRSLFCASETFSRNTCATSAAPSVDARTFWDGPRPGQPTGDDTTAVWVTRFGAPSRVRNALGQETILERGDARWPALVTRITDPRGHVVTARYDEQGRIVQSVDVNPDSASSVAPNKNATTTYLWDDHWDFVRSMTMPSGNTTNMAFDPATGDRLWQRPGDDPSRNVRFEYDALHSVIAMYTPLSTAPARYAYDDYGNLKQSTTAVGFNSFTYRDALGRDSVIRTPIDAAGQLWRTQRFSYDRAGRPLTSDDEAPSTAVSEGESQALHVRNEYDDEGNLYRVHRWTTPDPSAVGVVSTECTYDELGRKLTESDPFDSDHVSTTWQYDESGNVIAWTNRQSQSIKATYDFLNRVHTRTVPGTYNRVSGLSITDAQYFGYDESGNLVVANNAYAEVGRAFTFSGRLAYDTLRVHAADMSSVGMRHEYALVNSYDVSGRRIAQRQPVDRFGAGGGEIRYAYDAVTGDLEWVADLNGNRFTYLYHPSGLVHQLLMPGGMVETYAYDADGRPYARAETGSNLGSGQSLLHDERITRDARGKIIDVRYLGALGTTYYGEYGYSGLGATVAARTSALDYEDLRFSVDAFGNLLTKHAAGNERDPGAKTHTSSYEPHSNRLARVEGVLPRGATDLLTQSYDRDGNLTAVTYRQTTPPPPGAATHIDAWWTAAYGYAADGKLTVSARTTVNDNVQWIYDYRTPGARAQGHGSYEEYRYDALGRRVWKRAHRRPPWFPYCAANDGTTNTDCLSAVTVTVWDGDQVLYEHRAPAETTLPSYTVESNLDCPSCGSPAQHFGTVFYIHGADVDRPLELVKNSAAAVLHWTWRGQVDVTTEPTGQISTCTWPSSTPGCLNVDWPGLETSYLNARPSDRYQFGPKSWYGDLVQNHEDASRQQYRRNRYYDANTGRFTQEDPIGLAGGINLYGFAGGDHVNYSDPFGLCPEPKNPACPRTHDFDANDAATVFRQLGRMAPAINHEVATFLPKNLANAVGGLAIGRALGTFAAWFGARRGISVVHYTSADGAVAIEESGSLRAGSYVALSEEVGVRTAGGVERFLEIGKGKGAMHAKFRIQADALKTPVEGPTTSHGATQFQVKNAVPMARGSFRLTPR